MKIKIYVRNVSFTNTLLVSQISAFAQEDFDAGSIQITTNSLNVSDRVEISVRNNGLGNSGNISIVAQNLSLDNAGQLSAKVNSGEGGNISLSTDNIFYVIKVVFQPKQKEYLLVVILRSTTLII